MKTTYTSLVLFALLTTSSYSFEYKTSGGIQFFSKAGFNQSKINVEENRYPTDTWGAITGTLQIDADFLSQEQKDKGQNLTGSLGILVGGILFDASRNAGAHDVFFGGNSKGNSIAGKEYITENYVLYNAYLDYILTKSAGDANHILDIKIGRYRSKAQFYSGFTQGFEIDYKYKGLELWWFSSYGRAFAYSEWVIDFYAPKRHGNTYYGVHAFKPSYTFDWGLYLSPFVYFSPDFYVAPMLEIGFDSNPKFNGKGFRSTTKFFFLSPFHTKNAQTDYRYQFIAGKGGQTIALRQQFDINQFYFGFGWYQNFGNANAHVATYGNQAIGPWDFWTNTAFDFGALTNAITKNAKTAYLYAGGEHGKFSWDILGRMTYAIRANEQAVPLNLYYTFNNHFKVWLKIEWQNITTHKGFVIFDSTGYNPDDSKNKTKRSISQDRSHIMLNLAYSF